VAAAPEEKAKLGITKIKAQDQTNVIQKKQGLAQVAKTSLPGSAY